MGIKALTYSTSSVFPPINTKRRIRRPDKPFVGGKCIEAWKGQKKTIDPRRRFRGERGIPRLADP
jgi:hypothetical protein